MGGMVRAIESGWAKRRIERCAAEKQARIDRGEDVIVGVNKYRAEHEEPVEAREVDNTAVRDAQVRRLREIRAKRDPGAVEGALAALTAAAQDGAGNLLDLSIRAARVRATVGEISSALEAAFTRYQASTELVSGVYGAAFGRDEKWQRLKHEVEAFAADEGRRPRILIAKLGQDGHDRGAKVIATAFADLGFDVDVGPLFQTPEEAARQALENDVHIVGVSTLAAAHKTLVPALAKALREAGAGDVLIVVGGVIPAADYEFLKKAGAAAVFGPGTVIADAAREVLGAVRERRGIAAAAG
jgi:methylmalonyl-CoA mutase